MTRLAHLLLTITVLAFAYLGLLQAAGLEYAQAERSASVSVWIRVADCESGDGDGRPPYRADWDYNGLHDGGLQFVPSTWNAAKRLREVRGFAGRYGYAYQAPAWVQIRVADNWLRHTSWAQWPTCSRKLGLR